jgi:spore coat protein CotH
MKIAKVLFFFMLVAFHANALGNSPIVIGDGRFGVDEAEKLVVVNQPVEGEWDEVVLEGRRYVVESPVAGVQIGFAYRIISDQGEAYTLYFTELPLIFITADVEIVDEPKVPAVFTMVESNGNTTRSDMGIEIRGGSTQYLFAKKSYKVSFKEDASLAKSKDVSLLGMRSDNDWDFQAMANEPLRLNEKTCFDLWRKVNTLHYQAEEDEAINSCRMEYAELFLNGAYKGAYCVSEPVDRKQLKLKKYDDKKGIRGELYKGAGWGPTIFTSCPPYDNTSFWWVNNDGFGYEWIYPDEDEATIEWKGLHDFVYFVMTSSDTDFNTQYPNYFDINNAIDYYLFVNFIRAEDNKGNNLFVAKYTKDETYFYVPWDLDATFGNGWEGIPRDITDDIMSNGMYDRLVKDISPNGFKEKMEAKWKTLRKDWLTTQGLMNLFHENHNYLLRNGVYEREDRVWKNVKDAPYLVDSSYLEYLDKEFNYSTALPQVEPSDIQYPCDVYIYNVNGQLLKTLHATGPEDKALYSNLNKGAYILHFQTPNGKTSIQKQIIY